MAHQFVLGRKGKGEQVQVGHEHCEKCSACLIAGFTKEHHNCQARPVDKEILRVMVEGMGSTDERTRWHNRIEFERELQEYGFNIRA